MTKENTTGLEIAVIGMAGRFPGAGNLDEWWHNLKNGIEAITFFSNEELIEAGIDPELVENPEYVKSRGSIMDKKEYFDAAFFGYKPIEAEIMDPQTRLFLETSWRALEDAGYDPSHDTLTGLYAGSSWNFHWETRAFLSGRMKALGEFASFLLFNRDNLCTLVSYNLGLKGPSVFVKTTCSTSLVSVHLACQAILNGECDMSLAGGVSVSSQKEAGYLYQEGMINSPDGHCRAFDAEAKGTVGGEGVGAVVLKRLEEALDHKDYIHAVIKGTAINNDGSRKIGYTAPSIPGQVDVIREALQVANVEPGSITYIETHGTGTPVGDPIEIEALKTAFTSPVEAPAKNRHTCFIGSVKTNIGHLDAAAGIAGFIKTILALKHGFIPPSLHFQAPNPKIDFKNSPFRVNTALTEWKSKGFPLRAGVSSFGIGGTNVHVVLEKGPAPSSNAGRTAQGAGRSHRLILLSARTEPALEKMTENLANYLKKNHANPVNPGLTIGDVAYTLQIGRKAFKHRRALVCSTMDEAVEVLSSSPPESRKVRSGVAVGDDGPVVFMFPGLGAQYVNMGRELYLKEPVFREEMDHCFEILRTLIDDDIKDILYPAGEPPGTLKNQESTVVQLVVFIFEYALAKLLTAWGIRPRAMIGYSFGEYTAACISGVLSLEEVLSLVVLRGQLVQETAAGAMLSVPLPEKDLLPLLNTFAHESGTDCAVSLAIDNGPSCIVSGPLDQIETFEEWLKQKKHICVRLNAAHALHSSMMEPVLEKFAEKLKSLNFHEPGIPYISNVTGNWLTAAQAVDPGYWATHLKSTVRFAGGVKELLKSSEAGTVFLEVGPGYDLSTLFKHHVDNTSNHLVLNLIPSAPVTEKANQKLLRGVQGGGFLEMSPPGIGYLLNRLGRLWLSGVHIDWAQFHAGEQKQRVPLPGYPFEGRPYWLEGQPFKMKEIKKSGIADWFYIPSWKRSVLPPLENKDLPGKVCWLLFIDETGLGDRAAGRLEKDGQEVIRVRRGVEFAEINDKEYTIDPRNSHDYNTLFHRLSRGDTFPNRMIHCWSVTGEEKDNEEIQALGFYSLFYLARAVGKQSFSEGIQIMVVSNGLHRVTSEETLEPARASLLGAVKVIPREYFNISCHSIDIVLPQSGTRSEDLLIEGILREFSIGPDGGADDTVIALRGGYRWVRIFEPLRMEGKDEEKIPRLKEGGVYLITGGLGGIGLVLAEHLATKVRARLVLTGRSVFPAQSEWEQWLAGHGEEDRVSQKIRKIQKLEEAGAEILVCSADAGDAEQMRTALGTALERFGRIDGIIHAAGLPDGGVIPLRTHESLESILAPKVNGTLVLNRLLKEKNITLDFLVLCSSISAVLGLFGQVAYCAANAFLDAFAYHKTHEEGIFTVSINWDFWQEVGMGVETVRQLKENADISDADLLLKDGILPSEGAAAFDRVLNFSYPQVIVSVQDLASRFEHVDYLGTSEAPGTDDAAPIESAAGKTYPRPELTTEYTAPETEFEKTFADILQSFFGFQHVGIDDNLFEYGITSLDMIHINNVLRKKTAADIPILVMFEYPTIHSLGGYLEKCKEETGDNKQEQLEDLDKVEDLLHGSIDMFDNIGDN